MSALNAIAVCLARRAQRNKPLNLEGAVFEPADLRDAIADLADHCGRFLAHCDAMQASAPDDATREFWRRLAGSVRKAQGMQA